jgi:hypothetical protein
LQTTVIFIIMSLDIRIAFTYFLFLSLAATGLLAVNRVSVRAEAWDEFTTDRARDPDKKILTYRFLKGNYHPGSISDPSMEDLKFKDIVQDVALNLSKNNFIPDPNPETTDLLIVVHWGRTRPAEDSLQELHGYTSLDDMGGLTPDASVAFANPSNISSELEFNYNASLSISEANEGNAYYKSQLLGMEEAFDLIGSRYEEEQMKRMIDEERYFIILMAYDYQKLKEGETVMLWRTRYSMRALGQSFTAAIGQMNEVAGDYYGQNMKGLITKRFNEEANVKIGEVEVIDSEEPDSVN